MNREVYIDSRIANLLRNYDFKFYTNLDDLPVGLYYILFQAKSIPYKNTQLPEFTIGKVEVSSSISVVIKRLVGVYAA